MTHTCDGRRKWRIYYDNGGRTLWPLWALYDSEAEADEAIQQLSWWPPAPVEARAIEVCFRGTDRGVEQWGAHGEAADCVPARLREQRAVEPHITITPSPLGRGFARQHIARTNEPGGPRE